MNLTTTTGGQAATMSSREIAELVEARHNDVVTTIERLFDKGLLRSIRKTRRESTGGRPIDVYDLIERDTHLVVAGYSDEHRARVIDRWQELEEKRKSLPDVSSHEGTLLALQGSVEQQLALISENKQLAAERDHAIATKAQIGSRREAQAMAAASSAVRQVRRLEDELGRGTRFATVTAVEIATGTKYPFNAYVHLRKWCKANGVQPEIVPDRRFGKVKAWPAGAWAAIYQIDLATLFGASGAQA